MDALPILAPDRLLLIAILLLAVTWLAVLTAGWALWKLRQQERQRVARFELHGVTQEDLQRRFQELQDDIARRRAQILQAPRRPRGTAIPPQEA